MARRVEAKYPELDAGLLSAVEVEEGEKSPSGLRGYLHAAVVRAALEHGRTHEWDETVPTRALSAAKLAHAVSFGLLLTAFAALWWQNRGADAAGGGGVRPSGAVSMIPNWSDCSMGTLIAATVTEAPESMCCWTICEGSMR